MAGLPGELTEDLADRLLVVASDFPEWRVIVAPGQFAILVDPLDVLSIVVAIIEPLADRENAVRTGSSGRRAVVDKYDWGAEA